MTLRRVRALVRRRNERRLKCPDVVVAVGGAGARGACTKRKRRDDVVALTE